MSALQAMRRETRRATAAAVKEAQHPHPHAKEARAKGIRGLGNKAWEIFQAKKQNMSHLDVMEQQGHIDRADRKNLEGLYDEMQKNMINEAHKTDAKEHIGKRVAVGALASVPLFGLASAVPLAQSLAQRRKERNNYRTMLEQNPTLLQHDPEKVKSVYQVLETFSPSMTNNPLAAGGFVGKALEFEAIDPAEIKNLIDIEKGMGSTSGKTLADKLMQSAVTTLTLGGTEAVKAAV